MTISGSTYVGLVLICLFVATPTDLPSGETAIVSQASSSACPAGTTATANAAAAVAPAAEITARVQILLTVTGIPFEPLYRPLL